MSLFVEGLGTAVLCIAFLLILFGEESEQNIERSFRLGMAGAIIDIINVFVYAFHSV